jgi:hypothetical protein
MSSMSKIRKRSLRLLAAGTVAAGVMLPAVALAQDDTYPTPTTTPTVETTTPSGQQVTTGGATTSVDAGGGALPVTGGQIAGLTLIGLGITGAGVVMVRLGRRPVRVET